MLGYYLACILYQRTVCLYCHQAAVIQLYALVSKGRSLFIAQEPEGLGILDSRPILLIFADINPFGFT